MAEKELLVATTPQQTLVFTNMVYVAPGTFGLGPGSTAHVFVSGEGRDAPDHVFTVQEHPEVPQGNMAFNRLQRTCAKLSVGMDRVKVRLWQPPKKNFLLVSLSLEIDFANAKKMHEHIVIDVEKTVNNFKRLYVNQVFAVEQQLGIDQEGNMLKLSVKQTEVLNEDSASLEVAGEGIKAVHYMGQLTNETKLSLSKAHGRNIKFVNVPQGAELMTRSNLLKSGFNFENYGIGGLDSEADQVFRRAFASRIFPASYLQRIGVSHVKGILLYGPPGCGKTLMARQIGKMLNCAEPKIVNGPEILSKYVGESEKNVRELFAAAEKDQRDKGDESDLHLIIFDEFDAIVKQRGSTRDNTGVSDSVVNQLLSKIDGVDSLNNVLLIGMTNRKDLLDEALLRPGRFEVQIEVKLPDVDGRRQIFSIHTKKQKETGALAPDVDLVTLSQMSKNYTGAEIEGVVKAATSFALNRLIDYANPTKPVTGEIKITMEDFFMAMEDVKPAFGAAKDLSSYMRRGIYDYGVVWQEQMLRCTSYIAPLKSGGGQQVQSVLLTGSPGTGKTALAAYLAERSGFPFIKVVTGDDMTGFYENSKVNYIKKAFDDAHKSLYSVIILDELEDLIDYVSEGPRFSSLILQTLRRSIKKLPPEGSRILIIGTTSVPQAIHQLDFDHWDVKHQVPEISWEDVPAVLSHMQVRFVSPEEEKEALNCGEMPRFLPIKKLMQVVEMARALALANTNSLPELADKRQMSETSWRPVTCELWKTALRNLFVSRDSH